MAQGFVRDDFSDLPDVSRTMVRHGRKMHPRRQAVLASLSILLAIALGLLVRARPPGLDAWAVDQLFVAEDSGLGRFATAISGVGTIAAVALLAAVLVAARTRLRPLDLLKYAAILVAALVPMAAQYVFQREGPPQQPDWTYPSGHATVVTALVLLAFLAARRARTAVLLTGVGALLAVGVSRIALAEHYPTDLLGGVLGSVGLGLLVAAALRVSPRP